MAQITIYQVDAFTDTLFSGNPAAVCPLDEWPDDQTLQAIAAENNLSETAFFLGNDGIYQLRWFTPGTEVRLCGHATLASAHVLFNELGEQSDQVAFHTLSGELIVTREQNSYCMNFPARENIESTAPEGIFNALGIAPCPVYRNEEDYLLLLEDEDQVRSVNPDFASLLAVEARGIIITSEGKNCDFASRFFAPAVGVNEDPVTGSAHCALTPFWSQRLGKTEKLHARQIGKRGGELFCSLSGDRVLFEGRAITFLEGKIRL